MFERDSRYRFINVFQETTPARGAVRSTQLRIVPETSGRLLHRVHQSDRLDLLAYRYYRNSTAWWRICDANSAASYPLDLIDAAPCVQEHYVLDVPRFWTWRAQLPSALAQLGTTRWVGSTLFVTDDVTWLSTLGDASDTLQPPTRDCIVAACFSEPFPAQSLRAAITTSGLTLRDVHVEQAGPARTELWYCQDVALSEAWSTMLCRLRDAAGVLSVEPSTGVWSVRVAYNARQMSHEQVVDVITAGGFEVASSWRDVSEAKQLVIPPYTPVARTRE